MRHQIGEKIWVLWADIEDGFMYPFYTKLRKFAEMQPSDFPAVQFRELTVAEHHMVRGEYDDKDAEPAYDGYILTDSKGSVWHNQYPCAALGGQTSGGLDHMFEISSKCVEGRTVLDWMNESNGSLRGTAPGPVSMARVTHELREIRRELHTMETGEGYFGQTSEPDLPRAAKLRAWFEYILGEFGKQTGLSIIEEPHMYEDKNGAMKHLGGWYDFTIVEAPKDEA
jgi:hypothetical protein